ncbi:MAG: nucleoside triphosphate pyrophosphohydrolase, partial [Oscillospiraceae bacterium]|nr:nucleoside triphosphate pyrophosphohydrolase [Oscillospiraceae bacterium]
MVDSVYEPPFDFPKLLSVMALLRSEQGCPWDREQTHASIRQNLLEEAYEVCEAIDLGDRALLCEELGDVLLQVVFHARMEEEAGGFSIAAVIDGLCRKLIVRHPHVFGSARVEGSEEVLTRWEEIKQHTKGHTTGHEAMRAVARSLPALMRAEKIQKKARKTGFDWPDVEGAWGKLLEECAELRTALEERGNAEEEMGDLLFAAVNVARFLHVDPERALERACDKFMDRFAYVENRALSSGRQLEEMTLAEMDTLWDERKRLERADETASTGLS